MGTCAAYNSQKFKSTSHKKLHTEFLLSIPFDIQYGNQMAIKRYPFVFEEFDCSLMI